MRQLLDIISNHRAVNTVMPIIALLGLVAVLVIYILFKSKFIKYVFSIIMIIIGAVLFFTGALNMLNPEGLDVISTAAKVLLFGIVGLLFAIMLDILDSLFSIFNKKSDEQVKKETSKSKPVEKKETSKIKKDDSKTQVVSKKEIEKEINKKK